MTPLLDGKVYRRVEVIEGCNGAKRGQELVGRPWIYSSFRWGIRGGDWTTNSGRMGSKEDNHQRVMRDRKMRRRNFTKQLWDQQCFPVKLMAMKREGKKKMQVAMMKEGNECCELEEVEESNSQRRSGNKFKLSLETHSKGILLWKLLNVKYLSYCASCRHFLKGTFHFLKGTTLRNNLHLRGLVKKGIFRYLRGVASKKFSWSKPPDPSFFPRGSSKKGL